MLGLGNGAAPAGLIVSMTDSAITLTALFQSGLTALQNGQFTLAATQLSEAVALAPDRSEIHANLGEAQRRAHQLGEAVASFQRALALDPRQREAHYNLALVQLQQKRSDEARTGLERAIQLCPDFAEAHILLGSLHKQSGQLNEALEHFRVAALHQPNSAAAHYNIGISLLDLGQLDAAVESFRRAVALQPDFVEARLSLGNVLLTRGRGEEAIACFRAAVALAPNLALAHCSLGVALVGQKRPEEAVAAFERTIAVAPDFAEGHSNLGNLLMDQGRFDAARACFERAIALKPDLAETHNNLGNLLRGLGEFESAFVYLRRALTLKPNYADAHCNLGNLFKDDGRIEDALTSYRQALALNPESAETHNNIGAVLRETGQLDEAFASLQRALALKPTLACAHNNLGLVYEDRGQCNEARSCFERAIALQPGFAEAHNHLGLVLKQCGHFDEAFTCFQRSLALKPNFADTHNNLGNFFKDQGRIDQALSCYRQALLLQSHRHDIHSNLVFALHYHAGSDIGAIKAELRNWNQQHARPLAPLIETHTNDRTTDRRLRVGYVSPDFRDHAVGLNLLPLFERHAHDRFEIFSYARVSAPDEITARFRASSDHWRDTQPLSDSQLAATIRADRIDILVDLALHTANNRLPVFARKPAPVQISFAGYPGRTGLETIDYHLTDPYLEPPEPADAAGSDAPHRLPHTFWCYDPGATALTVSPLPVIANGYPTFGCLNNFCKINDTVVALWARVLLAAPRSRMLLLAPESRRRSAILQRFAHAGVEAERIIFVDRQSRQNYLETYGRIDLGLDTFPYNGHTTSLDSYWMGVPVVSLVGHGSVGRAGWSQLSNLGLAELAARTDGEFVNIAATLAGDLPRLAALRNGLRERMRHSPLMDASGFTEGIEAAYRMMWCRWCAMEGQAP